MEQTCVFPENIPACEAPKKEKIRYPIRVPYNFIPFSETVIDRYRSPDELPPHNVQRPDLLSGEIRVSITAETPIFLSGGGSPAQFTRDSQGRYCIPASSVRGLIRQNMQILGFGAVRPGLDIQRIRLFYRDSPFRAKSTDEGGEAEQPRPPVQSGYLHHLGKDYFIRPTTGAVLAVPRWQTDIYPPERETAPCAGGIRLRTARACIYKVFYKEEAGRVTFLTTDRFLRDGCRSGTLLCPNSWTRGDSGSPTGSLYLFPEEDRNAPTIPLTEEEILSHREDLSRRRKSVNSVVWQRFWALPEEQTSFGSGKPVFFVQKDGFTSFGVSRVPRLAYAHALSDGLPPRHQQTPLTFLDYPSAILGHFYYTTRYRSRVSVGTFSVQGPVTPMEPRPLLLGEPKPGFYRAYVKDGLDYNEDGFTLSGYKHYWLKPVQNCPARDNVASTITPLPPGTVFTGTIRYKNLHADELGLLLWSVGLEPGCMQSIGMGKPYGYGRVRIAIDALREYDMAALYRSLSPSPICADAAQRTRELIRCYDEKARELAGFQTPVWEQPTVQDFLYMKRTIREDVQNVRYMPLKEYRKAARGLQTVASIRTAENQPLE